MYKKIVGTLIIVGLLLSVFGCEDDIRTNLTVDERKSVNARYKAQLDSLNKSLIKECEDKRERLFESLVDSLKKSRIEEILLITKVKDDVE